MCVLEMELKQLGLAAGTCELDLILLGFVVFILRREGTHIVQTGLHLAM